MSPRFVRSWLALIIPLGIFTFLRLPAILHQPGGQDEQLFAVPGYTVWQEGIPRIPFFPARDRSTLFEGSDRCLLAMPPALFYCQAPFHAFFPAGYPTARLPLFVAGLVAIVLTFFLAKSFGANGYWAWGATGLFAISRPLMFTSTIARPDLLCVICGLGAILIWVHSENRPRPWDWWAIGGLCGLACLFHPFGLVFCMQAGLAVFASPGTRKAQCLRLAVLVSSVCIVAALWLPLILRYPDDFRSQFFANILDRAGPGLPSRLIWPIPSFAHHSRLIWEFAGPWQCLVLGACLALGSVAWCRSKRSDRTGQLLVLGWTSVYFTAAVAGIHPTKGYWVYSASLIFVLLAVLASKFLDSRMARRFAILILLLVMLPGAGLKTAWIYLRHWGEPSYHAPTFIQNVLKDYPQEGLYLSDLSYAYDLYLSGRKTILLKSRADYANQIDLDCDYIFTAWEGNDAGWADQYGPYAVRSVGLRVPEQACYVDILVPMSKP